MSVRSDKPCSVEGWQLISVPEDGRPRLQFALPLPLPNLGFSPAGFTSFHPGLAAGLVSVAPWGFPSQGEVPPPLRAPAHPGLSLPLAQSLRASQPARAWTFLFRQAGSSHLDRMALLAVYDLVRVDANRVQGVLEGVDPLDVLEVFLAGRVARLDVL